VRPDQTFEPQPASGPPAPEPAQAKFRTPVSPEPGLRRKKKNSRQIVSIDGLPQKKPERVHGEVINSPPRAQGTGKKNAPRNTAQANRVRLSAAPSPSAL